MQCRWGRAKCSPYLCAFLPVDVIGLLNISFLLLIAVCLANDDKFAVQIRIFIRYECEKNVGEEINTKSLSPPITSVKKSPDKTIFILGIAAEAKLKINRIFFWKITLSYGQFNQINDIAICQLGEALESKKFPFAAMVT